MGSAKASAARSRRLKLSAQGAGISGCCISPPTPMSASRPTRKSLTSGLILPVRRVDEILRRSLLSLEATTRSSPPPDDVVFLMTFCAKLFVQRLVQDTLAGASPDGGASRMSHRAGTKVKTKKWSMDKKDIDAAVATKREYEFLRIDEAPAGKRATEEGQEDGQGMEQDES